MVNKMLKPNPGKKGSYTIIVKKGYGVPDRSLLEIIKDIIRETDTKKK
ncbi:MAG: hypothetical protein V1867_01920 [Candidatus Falkowbacteria bacterium]